MPEGLDSGNAATCVLKHDVHGPPSMAIAMAKAEAAIGVQSTYFLMTEYSIYDVGWASDAYWSATKEILSHGHAVGLHFDLFEILARGYDLQEYVAQKVAAFAEHDVSVRYGNAHGDTTNAKVVIKPGDMFADNIAGTSRRDVWLRAVGGLSYPDFARCTSLSYWLDAAVNSPSGVLRPLYLTDSSDSLAIPARQIASPKFAIDRRFCEASLVVMRDTCSLVLAHPQWYDF